MVSFIPNRHSIGSASLQTCFLLSFVVIFFAEISRLFTLDEYALSVIWPPAGIFLAAVLVFGARVLPFLVVSMILWSQIFQSAPWSLSLLFSLGLAMGAWVGAKVMQRAVADFSSTQQLMRLYVGGVLVASGISSFLGSWGIVLNDRAEYYAFMDVWLIYWGFEGFAVMLFTPLAVLLLLDPKDLFRRVKSDLAQTQLKIWWVLSLLLASSSVLLSLQGQTLYATLIAYSFFPLLCWLVLTATRATLFTLLPIFAMVFVIFALKGWADIQLISSLEGLIKLLLQLASVILMAHLVATLTFDRNQLLQSFKRQSVRDHLTGLQNDRGLNAFLLDDLRKPSDLNRRLVQLDVLDFDHLRLKMGFDAACELERVLAQRLQAMQIMQLTRLSAGSYVWMMSDTVSTADAEIERLYTELNVSFSTQNPWSQPIQTAIASIPFEAKLDSPMKCLTALSQAIAVAKKLPRRIWKEPDAVRLIAQREQLIDQFEALKQALAQSSLCLYAQEIRALNQPADARLMFEVLIRFMGPNAEVMPPAQGLTVAKLFNYMPVVDYWVIDETFRYLSADPSRLEKIERCAINLSGQTLVASGLIDHVLACFARYPIKKEQICFEITETEVIEDDAIAAEVIHALRAMGCKIALDDFGTGLATFDYLHRYPFDYLKIDGRFIKHLLSNPIDQVTVKAIASVAAAMQLDTVAEFVESESMIALLAELGVTYVQGYAIAHPRPLHTLL